ncbi:hypothetical protein [Catenovulum sediminis]|uniref:DUF1634 domain-containing protein n=1 Tax=Catenovulum sediminis TaxID=1740262 RepID=A0ABV1RM12_9ALTE|nr:hypothetical protein [Catenovulum sediminis]
MINKQKTTKNNEIERRKGSDALIKVIRLTNLLAWLSFILAMIWFRLARPEKVPGYAKYKKIEDTYRDVWLQDWTDLLFIQLVICSVITVFAMVLNLRRLKRKSDHFHYNLILLLLVCIAAVLYLLFNIFPQF